MDRDMTENRPPRPAHAKPAGRPRDERERIDRARAAAEALFRPKPQQAPLATSGAAAEPAQRKPRILTSSPGPAEPAPGEAAADPEAPTPSGIPQSQFARIRVWVKYGMTIPEVAQFYGVSIGEIERILRDA
jgi:hypothetical protein